MGQAAARRLAEAGARDLRLLWYGNRPLEDFSELLVERRAVARFVDCHGYRRLKTWKKGGAAGFREAVERVRREVEPERGPVDVWTGNDNEMFFRAAMEACGAGWDRVTLFEEGVGFYAGSGRPLEKAAVALLALLRGGRRGSRHRLFWRDFSANRRIRRLACNHPGLLAGAVGRRGAEVLDTGEAYRAVLGEIAAAVARREGPGARPPVERLYVSGNFHEAGHLGFEEELRMVAALREGVERELGAGELHVKFHPLDGEPKRRRIVEMGLRPLGGDGPLEIDCLLRRHRHLFSYRSSAVLNLSLLDLPELRLWLVRGRLGRKLDRRRVRRVFDRLAAGDPRVRSFDPGA